MLTVIASSTNGYATKGNAAYEQPQTYQYDTGAGAYNQEGGDAKGSDYWDPVRDSVRPAN